MNITDANGLVWHNGGPETDDHLTFGGHESYILEIAKSLLPEKGVFLDVGAHVGLYTLNLALKASHVYAVEANPDTFGVLAENIQKNEELTTPTIIEAINVAAWDHLAPLDLIDANGKDTGGSTRCEEVPPETSDHATLGVPLDHMMMSPLHLVKIDVEGAEARVLRGMAKTVERDHPILLIEMHDIEYDNPQIRTDVLKILKEWDYEHNLPESLIYGGQYYLIAKYRFAVDAPDFDFDIDVVRVGE